MSITIGEQKLATRRPQDLDARLETLTGCNAAEARRWLGGTPQAGHVAAALMPFLDDDAPSLAELADMIARSGIPAVAVDVAALYDDQAEASAQ